METAIDPASQAAAAARQGAVAAVAAERAGMAGGDLAAAAREVMAKEELCRGEMGSVGQAREGPGSKVTDLEATAREEPGSVGKARLEQDLAAKVTAGVAWQPASETAGEVSPGIRESSAATGLMVPATVEMS